MTLQETIQDQIDEIMDSFDFAECARGLLALAERGWVEDECPEDLDYRLRRHARKMLRDAAERALKDRSRDEVSNYISDSGFFRARITVCREAGNKWAKVNLTCYIESTINDGVEYE